MNDNQLIVLKWMVRTDNFQDMLIELDGAFKSVPNEVCEAYENISQKEKIEVMHKATGILLKELC
ncbi:hypothetical protein ABD91_21095 [Lysinibacillus sphaericus]|uniref:hypothetical protein n=1 Tax=Lysinibacillus sphaericus TaxID=1421 RepID=UPI0018CE6D8A|nr:hypothetical protein [Lysinibacillus sphaericus]MBG9693238.1 hypothetical protein [Lysinibacillus sphaericus]